MMSKSSRNGTPGVAEEAVALTLGPAGAGSPQPFARSRCTANSRRTTSYPHQAADIAHPSHQDLHDQRTRSGRDQPRKGGSAWTLTVVNRHPPIASRSRASSSSGSHGTSSSSRHWTHYPD